MLHRFALVFVVLGGGLWLAAWHSPRLSAHVPITTTVTWNKDVVGILERRCLACHRDEGPAPMALTSYEAARPWARAMREEVLARRMPPTGLRSGGGLYDNARGLSLAEAEMLVSWADGGAPRGTGDEVRFGSPARAHLDGVAPAVPLPADAGATRRLVRVSVPAGWIGAWTFDPGTWPAVSAVLNLPGQVGVADWTAGDPPVEYPDGTGLRIPAPGDLTLEVALSRPLNEATRAQTPSLRFARRSGVSRPIARATAAAPVAVTAGERLLALRLGLADPEASGEVFIARRGGDEEFLLAMGPPGVPDTVTYRLRTPLGLEPGDRIEVRATSAFTLALESSK